MGQQRQPSGWLQWQRNLSNIISGGSVSNTLGYIGYYSGSAGTATVDGAGSTWTNGSDLTIGYSGSGTLNITDGGAVSVTGTTYVGSDAGSTGAINFGAERWNADDQDRLLRRRPN